MAQFRKDTHQFLNDGKTIFETVMLADQYGNLVGAANPTGGAVDAFGRARYSEPFTLFDSFHRYQDNGKASYSNTAGGTYAFNANTSSIDAAVGNTSGQYVYSETNRVFAYQPGKSLQVLTTFVMNPHQTNLRQRVGYFDANNGFFLERSDATSGNVCFVKRSSVTGVAVDTRIDQSQWNLDKMDGTGVSLETLNLDCPQILFIDVQWLGVGATRMGFIVDNKMVICHEFVHANITTSPKGAYMQTACLPLRYEIENIGNTDTSSTFKKICGSVISEGGYNLRGSSRSVSLPIANSITLPVSGTFYPIMSIRLKDTRPNAIVIPKSVEFFGTTNNRSYRYKIITGCTLDANASWQSAGSDSAVEYDVSATGYTANGIDRKISYVNVSSGAGGQVDEITTTDIFQYQLERNIFAANNVGTIFSLAATSSANNSTATGSITWEEIFT